MSNKNSSLTAQLGILLVLASIVSACLFGLLYFGGSSLLRQYFENSSFQEVLIEKRIRNLQDYVQKNDLSVRDSVALNRWAQKDPLILMEIYRSNILLYSSSAPASFWDEENESEVPHYDWISYYQVTFADGDAQVVIYANDTYHWFSILTIGSLLLSFLVFLSIFLRGCKKLVYYICQLSAEIQALEGGDLDAAITIKGNHELTRLARSLDSMRQAFKEQREEESRIFRASQLLITEMSHDLRTPLTTLQIYTDILRYKKYETAELDDYLKKIDAKVSQIKQLSDNIFEYALISRHQEIHMESPVLLRQVFHDILSESVAYWSLQGFRFDLKLDWPETYISVYSPYIKRLMDNISSNLIKYADPVVPLLIEIIHSDDYIGFAFQNAIKRQALKTESTHIGLSNMHTMMDKMDGKCLVFQTVSTFRLELLFPVHPSRKSNRSKFW